MKLLFLGLDGCAYEKVSRFDCPFLQSLCRKYQHGILRSDDPFSFSPQFDPWTGPAWNTVYTGVDAQQHQVDADDWAQGNTAHLASHVPTVFDFLGRDYTLGLMAMPALNPTGRFIDEVGGWVITGFPAEGKVIEKWKYPKDLKIPKDFKLEDHHRCHEPKHFVEAMEQVKDKIGLFVRLSREHETEIGGIGIQFLDFVDHSTNEVGEYYEFIDKQVKRLFSAIKPTDFIICSDHGFRAKDHRHSMEGFYACSLEGIYREKSNFDIAPLALWLVKRRHLM